EHHWCSPCRSSIHPHCSLGVTVKPRRDHPGSPADRHTRPASSTARHSRMGPRSITRHIPFDTDRASRRRSTGSEACSRSGSRLIIARNFRARSTGLVSRSTLSTRSSPSRCTGLATCTQWLLHILLCADHLADLHDYRMRWSSALPRRGCQEPGEQLPKVRKTVQLRSSSDILGPGGITTPRCVLPRARIWGLLNKYWGFDAEQQEEIRAQDSGCYRCSWMPDHEQHWGHCSRNWPGQPRNRRRGCELVFERAGRAPR